MGSFSCFVICVGAVTIQAHLLQPHFRAEQIPAMGTLHWWCSPSPFHGCWLCVQIPTSNFGSVPGSEGNLLLSSTPGALSTTCRSPEQGVWITPCPPGSSHAAVHRGRTVGEFPGECPRQCDNSPCAQEAPSCCGGFQPEPHSNSQSPQEQMEKDRLFLCKTTREVLTEQAGNNHIHGGSGDLQFVISHLLEGDGDTGPFLEKQALLAKQ